MFLKTLKITSCLEKYIVDFDNFTEDPKSRRTQASF
jgi:hypothetical protein